MKYDIHELSLEEKIGQMIIIGLNTETAVKNLEERNYRKIQSRRYFVI